MCDEDKVILILNKQVVPQITELQKDLEIMVNDLKHFTDTHNSVISRLENEIATIRKTLYGNGNPDDVGLKSEVKQVREWISNRVWFERLIIGLLAAETIGIIAIFIQNVLAHID